MTIHFGLSQEQQQLRSSVRRFIEVHSSLPAVQHAVESAPGHDLQVWRLLCDELDLVGLAVPGEYGGSGGTVLELCIALSELGRGLYTGPFLSSSLLAAPALLALADEPACRSLLPLLVRGEVTVTVAGWDHWPGSPAPLSARPTADGWTVTGEVARVIDGVAADFLVVFAETGSGPEGFLVDAAEVERAPEPSLDPTRQLSVCLFNEANARLLGSPGRGQLVLEELRSTVAVGIAAEATGAAERILGIALEHAKHRTQFGQPIGSFQAVQHLCVDAHLAVENAKRFALLAAWSLSVGNPDAPVSASAAMACSTEAFVLASETAIQVLGGIGYTWEHPAHLFLKRAISSRVLFGTPQQHRERHLSLLLADE